MARLIVGERQWVFNANFTHRIDLVQELDIPVGTECTIQHCAQDKLPDQVFVVEDWMVSKTPLKLQPRSRKEAV